MRSQLQLLHQRLTQALTVPPAQQPTFTTRAGLEQAVGAVERAVQRYDAGDVAGAAQELRDNEAVVVDAWEWDPLGHAYLDCLYGLENNRTGEEITPEQHAAILAADAARASRRTDDALSAAPTDALTDAPSTDATAPRRAPWSQRRRNLLVGGIGVLIAVVVVSVELVFRPDYPEVTRRLSELYGAQVEWRHHGKFQRDDIVLDGRNIGDHCVVEGEWFGLDDLRISCDDPAYQPVRVK